MSSTLLQIKNEHQKGLEKLAKAPYLLSDRDVNEFSLPDSRDYAGECSNLLLLYISVAPRPCPRFGSVCFGTKKVYNLLGYTVPLKMFLFILPHYLHLIFSTCQPWSGSICPMLTAYIWSAPVSSLTQMFPIFFHQYLAHMSSLETPSWSSLSLSTPSS